MEDGASRTARLILALRRSGLTESRVLRAMESVPRDRFLPEALRDRVEDDEAVPVAHGAVVPPANLVAWAAWAAEVDDQCKVLEVGTGAGYQAAVLARLARRLYTVDRHRDLAKAAEGRFDALKLRNVVAKAGNPAAGWPEQAPFDRIVINLAVREPPPALLDQLAMDGVMVAVLGLPEERQALVRLRRDQHGYHRERVQDVRFVPMLHGMGGAA